MPVTIVEPDVAVRDPTQALSSHGVDIRTQYTLRQLLRPVIMTSGIVSVNGWPGHVGPIENVPPDNWINSMESLSNGLSGYNSVLMYDLKSRLDS